MPLRAWWNCRDCVQCDCGIYGCHYPISVSGAWKRSAPGTAPRPARTVVLFQRRGDYCRTLGFNLQVLCHNKCWTVLEGKSKGRLCNICRTAQVLVWRSQGLVSSCLKRFCFCAQKHYNFVSLQSSQCVGCSVISFRLSKRPFSYIYDWGKALVAVTFPGSHLRWEPRMCAVFSCACTSSHMYLVIILLSGAPPPVFYALLKPFWVPLKSWQYLFLIDVYWIVTLSMCNNS